MIEPSSGGAGFYSSVFVVLKHTGGLWPILNLKQLNCYLHLLLLRCLLSDMSGSLFSVGDYAFSIDLQYTYLHIPIFKHHCWFL